MDKITIVVCTRNVRNLVQKNLPIVRKNLPNAEILVIDGDSTDGTKEIAATIADRVISDEGKGLAHARQVGIARATRPFVAFIGPDNIVDAELMEKMRVELERALDLAAVAPQTEVLDARTYWEKTTKYIFQYMINRPGEVDVVGTPCMYKRETVLKIPYDASIKAAGDDTDLSLRLKNAGYRLKIIDAFSHEKNELDRKAFIARWKWYGKGDAEFYAKHKNSWTLRRRLQSLTHPFRKYAVRAAALFIVHGVPQYIPALYIAVWARYTGWGERARALKAGARR